MKLAVNPIYFFLLGLVIIGITGPKQVLALPPIQASLRECLAFLIGATAHSKKAQQGEARHGIDGYLAGEYEYYFSSVTGGKGLSQLARARKTEKLARAHPQYRSDPLTTGVHLLEVGGSAVFADDPSVFDSLTGVRLGPVTGIAGERPIVSLVNGKPKIVDPQIPTYGHSNWSEVHGNALLPSFWNTKLNENLRSRGIFNLDFIIIRPIGGFSMIESAGKMDALAPKAEVMDKLPSYEATLFTTLKLAFSRLHQHGGTLLTDVPFPIAYYSPRYKEWIKRLKSMDGIEVEAEGHQLRLTKTSLSATLPSLSEFMQAPQ